VTVPILGGSIVLPGMPPKAGPGDQPVRPVTPGRAYVVLCSVPILQKRALVVWVLLQNQTPHDFI
jgi:hypothetical protein